MPYNDFAMDGGQKTGFELLPPEARRSKSSEEAAERLAKLDRRLAEAMSTAQIDGLAAFAEHVVAFLEQGHGSWAEISPLTGRKRAPLVETTSAARRNLYRQFALRRRLVEDSLTASEVAELLGTTRQTPHDRVKAETMLAVKDGGKLRFPAWQFDPEGPGGTVAGLPETLHAMGPIGELGRLTWFLSPKPQLQGRTPLAALKDGDVAQVVAEAQAVGTS